MKISKNSMLFRFLYTLSDAEINNGRDLLRAIPVALFYYGMIFAFCALFSFGIAAIATFFYEPVMSTIVFILLSSFIMSTVFVLFFMYNDCIMDWIDKIEFTK